MTNEELDVAIIEWVTNNQSLEPGEIIEGVQVTPEDRQRSIKSTTKIIYDMFERFPEVREQYLAGNKEDLIKGLEYMFDNMWLFPLPGMGDDAAD